MSFRQKSSLNGHECCRLSSVSVRNNPTFQANILPGVQGENCRQYSGLDSFLLSAFSFSDELELVPPILSDYCELHSATGTEAIFVRNYKYLSEFNAIPIITNIPRKERGTFLYNPIRDNVIVVFNMPL